MRIVSACQELSSRELVSLSVTVLPSLSQSCKSRIVPEDELASFHRTGRVRKLFMMSEWNKWPKRFDMCHVAVFVSCPILLLQQDVHFSVSYLAQNGSCSEFIIMKKKRSRPVLLNYPTIIQLKIKGNIKTNFVSNISSKKSVYRPRKQNFHIKYIDLQRVKIWICDISGKGRLSERSRLAVNISYLGGWHLLSHFGDWLPLPRFSIDFLRL